MPSWWAGARPWRPSSTDRRPVTTDADHEPGGLVLAFPLIALAGWVDALGVVQWHGLYASFMSGHSTTLGAAPAMGDWGGAFEAARAVAVFLAGTVAGELIGPAARDWRGPAVVASEAACLWLAFAGERAGWGLPAVAAATGLAMGLQTAAVHKVEGTGIALTYVTGTLVSLGRAVASGLRGTGPWRKALLFAGCWLSLVAGAAAGGLVARTDPAAALGAAAGAATITAALTGAGVALRRARRAS